MTALIFAFITGFITASVLSYIIFAKREICTREKLIKLQAQNDANENLQEIIKRDFVQLANETIKNEQEDLRKQNREAIEEKFIPLAKELKEFKAKIESYNLSGVENTTKIVEQISILEKNNKVIEQETKNLVDALTKNQNTKGAYGENLLETILQSCGMKEGIHYSKQFRTTSENVKDNSEHIIRPDFIINLPYERHLVIDSKVTLTSYLEYIENPDKLKEFKSAVKARISELANKNYQNANDLYQPDFILMYMPIETSVSLLYEDMDLIQNAYKSNIIIIGTSSLLTVIRLVNQMFAQQKQKENIQQIVNAGTDLYETFVQFCEDLMEVQKRFEGVETLLNKTINRFKRNNKNKPSLFSQVEALKEFGISSNKEIPKNLLKVPDKDSTITELSTEDSGVYIND